MLVLKKFIYQKISPIKWEHIENQARRGQQGCQGIKK